MLNPLHKRRCYCYSIAEQINTNSLQSGYSPLRILFLVPCIQLAKELFDELRISILENSFSRQSHQVQLVVHVVHRKEMGAGRFLRGDMVDVGPCDAQPPLFSWTTASTLTAFLNRPEILGICSIADIEHPGRCDGVAKPLRMMSMLTSYSRTLLTAVLVGHTQSNISAPRATETTKSSG